jgi:hypothetical protein
LVPFCAERWIHESGGSSGCLCRKIFEFTRANLALSLLDPDGRVRLLCCGEPKLEQIGPFKVLKVLDVCSREPEAQAGPCAWPCTWIYRVAGETLALVSNLEQTARGGEPSLEIFVRTGKETPRPSGS